MLTSYNSLHNRLILNFASYFDNFDAFWFPKHYILHHLFFYGIQLENVRGYVIFGHNCIYSQTNTYCTLLHIVRIVTYKIGCRGWQFGMACHGMVVFKNWEYFLAKFIVFHKAANSNHHPNRYSLPKSDVFYFISMFGNKLFSMQDKLVNNKHTLSETKLL